MASVLFRHGHFHSVNIPNSVIINRDLTISRSDYFRGFFTYHTTGDFPLSHISYPSSSCAFSLHEFNLALCILNTSTADLLLHQFDISLISYSSIYPLMHFFQSSFLLTHYIEQNLQTCNAHIYIPDLAKNVGSDHSSVQNCCDLLFQSIGIPFEIIKAASVSRTNPSIFVHTHLKQRIRQYSRRLSHFWRTHDRHSPRVPCPICASPVAWTPHIRGDLAQVKFMPCCFNLAHMSCFRLFMSSSHSVYQSCPMCNTTFLSGYLDPSVDDDVVVHNRTLHLRRANICRYSQHFPRHFYPYLPPTYRTIP